MEFFILIISVPLFLIVVLLISVFVLANYSGNEPAKGPPAKDSPTEVKAPDTTRGEDNVIA
jgi:hypothetical protein